MTQPYRAATEPSDSPRPPRDLVLRTRERDLNASFHRVWILTLFLGIGGAVVCAVLGVPQLAWIPIVGVFAWAVVRWRQVRDGSAITMRAEAGRLTVTTEHGRRTLLELPLKSLLDVQLDTRSITPATRNTEVETLGIGMRTRGTIDVSRVVLVPMDPRDPVALSEEDLAHMDAVELASQIRRFLRAHGWLPEDERAA